MRSILEKMWYGNLNPQEQSFENNEETRRLLLEMEDRRAELLLMYNVLKKDFYKGDR